MQVPATAVEAAAWLAFHFDKLQPYLPTYTHLLVSACAPIYAGAHASLSRPSSAAKPAKKASTDDSAEDDAAEEEHVQRMEGLSTSDAFLFPVMAGCTLTALYLIIKWLEDPALLNKILNWYFAGFSVFSVSRLVSDGLDVFHSILFPRDYVDGGRLFHVSGKRRLALPAGGDEREARTSPLPGPFSRLPLPRLLKNFFWFLYVVPNQRLTFKAVVRGMLDADFKLGIHGIEGLTVGLLSVIYFNFVGKPWFLTNLFGFGFAYGALQLLSPTTFATGTLLLSLLFFYDVYFVFYTPMMVGVAKSLDVPVKLLFPAPPRPDSDPSTPSLSMLGLGDVVLPGIMIGLALRFDLFLFYLSKQTKSTPPSEESSKATTDDIVKAPYKSMAEAWGDLFWTSRLVSSFCSPLSKALPRGSYTARNVFPKPYFTAGMVGYVFGMLATLLAMQISDHPQPALLYLVPGVLGSLWITALIRGETKLMWAFSDAAEEEASPSSEQKGKDAKSANNKQGDEKHTNGTESHPLAEETNDKASNQKSTPASSQKDNRSVIEKLADRLDKQLDSSAKASGAAAAASGDRTLVSFSITLPPLLEPGRTRSTTEESSRWAEGKGGSQSPEHKPDAGHSDKRIRLE